MFIGWYFERQVWFIRFRMLFFRFSLVLCLFEITRKWTFGYSTVHIFKSAQLTKYTVSPIHLRPVWCQPIPWGSTTSHYFIRLWSHSTERLPVCGGAKVGQFLTISTTQVPVNDTRSPRVLKVIGAVPPGQLIRVKSHSQRYHLTVCLYVLNTPTESSYAVNPLVRPDSTLPDWLKWSPFYLRQALWFRYRIAQC